MQCCEQARRLLQRGSMAQPARPPLMAKSVLPVLDTFRTCAGPSQLDFGARCGTARPGDVLGELALASPCALRPCTARAAVPESAPDVHPDGSHEAARSGTLGVLCIERALFRHFDESAGGAAAGHGAVRGQVAAALRAACCRRLLATRPGERSVQDVQALVAFLHPLEVRSRMSKTKCRRNANTASIHASFRAMHQ